MNQPPQATLDQLRAGLMVLMRLSVLIRFMEGPVPIDTLYEKCMPTIDREGFNKAIESLKRTKLIRDAGLHQVEWCGRLLKKETNDIKETNCSLVLVS